MAQIPHDLPHVALSGRSNVGKSSLLNALAGSGRLARISSSPGKTITINFYDIGGEAYLADLPGYGYAKRSGEQKRRWSALIEQYLEDRRSIVGVIQLIDLKVGATADDRLMLEWLAINEVPFAVAATKADKLNKTEREASLASLKKSIYSGAGIIPFSAVTGEGADALRSCIQRLIRP